MKILGKQIGRWWLLAFPVLLFVFPSAALTLFFLGNDLAGAILGPPAIWSKTWSNPPREEVVGKYIESGHRTLNQIQFASATVDLAADGSMLVEGLPYEFGETSCFLVGKGRWDGPDEDQKITLDYTSNGSSGSCGSSAYTFLEITGHFKPHRLYWTIGDPDSGIGVWLEKGR